MMRVTVVSEVSIDGKLTLGSGNSSKELFELLTESDMKFIHHYRGKADGILVGMNTIRVDNPSLTCRYEMGENPIRIVPTNSLDIPSDATILNDNVKTILVTNRHNEDKIKELESRDHISVVTCGDDKIDLVEAFDILENEYNIKSIMLEGGGLLNWSVIDAGLVDEMIIIQLPIIIGGKDNVSFVDGEGYCNLKDVKQFDLVSVEMRKNVCIMKYKKR